MVHVRERNKGTRGFLPVPDVVFSTKYGRRILTNHVRPLVCQPPKIAPGTLIDSLKGRVVSADQKREVSQNHRPPLGQPFLVTQPMHRKPQRRPA